MVKKKTIGQKLKQKREELGWSQGRLATEVKKLRRNIQMAQANISMIESGVCTDPGVSKVCALEDALGIDRGSLMPIQKIKRS